MIGTPLARADIDYKIGQVSLAANLAFENIRQMQAWLAGQTDAVLEAAPFGYTAGEVAVIKSAFANLDQLRTIYEGSAALAAPQDFRVFARQVWGFGF